MKVRYNELEDFETAVKRMDIRVIYIDLEYSQQPYKVVGADGKEGVITRAGVTVKLTATNDKFFYCWIKPIYQKDLQNEADVTIMNNAVKEEYDKLTARLHDELRAVEVTSGAVEAGI